MFRGICRRGMGYVKADPILRLVSPPSPNFKTDSVVPVPRILPQRLPIRLPSHGEILNRVRRQDDISPPHPPHRRQTRREGGIDGRYVRVYPSEYIDHRVEDVHKLRARPGEGDFEQDLHPAPGVAYPLAMAGAVVLGLEFGPGPGGQHG